MVGTSFASAPALDLGDQDISDAYLYLLGRLLVARQQQVDFDQEGFVWNQLVHREPGQVAWPNPNLDVAYSEAWVAIDETAFLLVTVPRITGRYYVVQFLNGWGETVANINERVYPDHPDGLFAVCLAGSKVDIPAGAVRIDVPVTTLRVLLRVELGDDWDGAITLQHAFAFEIRGVPRLPEIPRTILFEMEDLPGAEAFDSTTLALREKDINPGMEAVQANARAIAKAIEDPDQRARVGQVIRTKTSADLVAAMAVLGHGTKRNGWARPACCGQYGADWLTRSLINLGGIWANIFEEVIYYIGNEDGTGTLLDPDGTYTLTFPAEDLPEKYAKYFWSIIAVDRTHRRGLPNPLKKDLLNREAGLVYEPDGSLELHFASEKPAGAPAVNWLPTKGKPWKLTFRFYGPRGAVADGTYFPPPLVRR